MWLIIRRGTRAHHAVIAQQNRMDKILEALAPMIRQAAGDWRWKLRRVALTASRGSDHAIAHC